MAKRALLYVLQQPGPKKGWYLIGYGPDGHVLELTNWMGRLIFGTQKERLAQAKTYAKAHQPSSVIVQRKDGTWREVDSYPAVRNKDERKRPAKKK